MKADFLFAITKLATGEEPILVECEGYELEVYGIEYDEFEEVIRLKASFTNPDDDEENGPPWLDNNDDEDDKPPGSIHDKNVCPVERPMESFEIDGPEPKEG